jgi:threonine/homoserine/homoserine lactone efflux protein
MARSIAALLPAPLPMGAFRAGAIGALIVASLAIMGSPGPATISLTAAVSAFGVRRSLGYLVGIILGTALVLVTVATGITAALLAVPALRVALIAVAGAYILWLAYRVATAPPLESREERTRAPSVGAGVLLGFANPKAWVAIGAVFTSTRLAGGTTADAAGKVVVLSLMIVVIMTGWLILGASFAPILRHPIRARILNVCLAIALVSATALAVLR